MDFVECSSGNRINSFNLTSARDLLAAVLAGQNPSSSCIAPVAHLLKHIFKIVGDKDISDYNDCRDCITGLYRNSALFRPSANDLVQCDPLSFGYVHVDIINLMIYLF